MGYVRKRHAYRAQLAEPDPTQVSDLKIFHGKLVKKKHAAVRVYARSCPYCTLSSNLGLEQLEMRDARGIEAARGEQLVAHAFVRLIIFQVYQKPQKLNTQSAIRLHIIILASRTSWARACLPAPLPWSSAISSSDLPGTRGLLTFVIS